MAFKDDIEAMCARAIRDGKDVMVKLPKPPIAWSQDQIEDRLFQLATLIAKNGCTLSTVNIRDFRISKKD